MSRQILSEEALVSLINREISSNPDIPDCSLSCIYKLAEEDDSGCNWSVGYFSTGNVPPEVSSPLVQNVIDNISSKYNVAQ